MTRTEKAEKLLAAFEAGEIYLSLNMNDVFGFACSESEDISFKEELEPALQLFDEFGNDGWVAYATIRRGMTGLPANPAYHTEAFKGMLERAKALGVVSEDERYARLKSEIGKGTP